MKSVEDNIIPEMMMFYNVENLFLPDFNFKKSDSVSKSGLKNWSLSRYELKIQNIARVFQLVSDLNGQLPLIAGLAEVQGKQPLMDILRHQPFSNSYQFVHYESMDERGIDVALLYDASKIEILHSEPITYLFETEDENPYNYDTTRDVLWCKAKYKEAIFHIFVVHLPSKRTFDINRFKRNYILKNLRKRFNDIEKDNEAIVVMGDFNQNPDEGFLKNFLQNEKEEFTLYNPFSKLFKNKQFSTFHQRCGLLFDQIIISEQFLNNDYFPLKFSDSEVFSIAQLSNFDRRYIGRPYRTYAGTRYLGGYSDHFPVLVKFTRVSL